MCTLSFIPTPEGYVIGMNRDEQKTRPRPMPPSVSGNAVYPKEPATGGTWLAINARGLTLALLNKNEDGPLPVKLRSRGEIIPTLISSDSLAEVHRGLLENGFKGLWSFRLIAFSFAEHEICEWAYGAQLSQAYFDWAPRHWFSSGMSDIEANRVRTGVVEQAWQKSDAGTPFWLRALHKSHEPRRGAYSICVHREDAKSVSYSEVMYENGISSFRYATGSPCESSGFDTQLSLPSEVAGRISC